MAEMKDAVEAKGAMEVQKQKAAEELTAAQAKIDAAREKIKADREQKEAREADRQESALELSAAQAKIEAARRKIKADRELAALQKKVEDARAQIKAQRNYTVKPGDSLSAIAKEVYGKAGLWTKIYEANKDVIGDNPNLIHPGQEYVIPAEE